VVSPEVEFAYKCTDYWVPEHERSIKWNDTSINIKWPLIPGIPGLSVVPPLLSEKDENGVLFESAEIYV